MLYLVVVYVLPSAKGGHARRPASQWPASITSLVLYRINVFEFYRQPLRFGDFVIVESSEPRGSSLSSLFPFP